jgi:hypothetical protein
MSHTHDDDSDSQRNRAVASPTSSVRAQTGHKEVDSDDENEEECGSILSRKINSCSDIEDILHDCVPIQNSKAQGILALIENIYRESRGFEIGTFNSSILSSVLKKQSAKWPSLAEGYICDIISMVHMFIKKSLTISCRDQGLGQNILSFLYCISSIMQTSWRPWLTGTYKQRNGLMMSTSSRGAHRRIRTVET